MESVAKHYGYVSDYLDVTRDLMTALFFAYTYFDKDSQQILPFPDFKYNTPYLYIGNLNELYLKAQNCVKDIGFQPFPRAKAQQMMSINVSNDFDYIKSLFKKVELPKNPSIAKYVYNIFDGGKLLIPEDYASNCARQVKGFKTLQKDLFEKYCEDTKTDIVWLAGECKKLGYEFVNEPFDIQDGARSTINKEIDEIILPYLDDGFIFRGIKGK